jgi:hypothetical protein
MRNVWMAAAALVAMAGAAEAQSATQTITLTARVDDYCASTGGSSATGAATMNPENGNPTTLQSTSGQQTSFTCTQNVTISTDSSPDGMLRTVTLTPRP